ncbi:MAG: hypothetical protein QM785_03340 [Pyrinomonadaceae bacterium]
MSKNVHSSKRLLVSLAIFALFGAVALAFNSSPASASGNSVFDSVRGFFGMSIAPSASQPEPMVFFNSTAQTLPFSQDWTNTGLITTNDDWSGVPGVEGYLGQDITTGTGVDPQTLLTTSGVANDLDVVANQAATATNGGVLEVETSIANPTIAI